MTKTLSNSFYNLDNPSSFSSHNNLRRTSGKTSRAVTKFLEAQPVYSRHKQVRFRFPRRRTTGEHTFSHVQADLIDLSAYARNNKGFRFALTMIDCFSRFAFAIPIHRKTGGLVAQALRSAFESVGKWPTFLVTDRGREFENQIVKGYLEENAVNLIHPESEIKCAMVERFNRTFETRLHKYFTHTASKKWIDVASKITDAINNSWHRIIKCTPRQVFTGQQTPAPVPPPTTAKKPKYKLADIVRMSRPDAAFRRGYLSGWTEETFQVTAVIPGSPPVYRLVDFNGEEIAGIVYEQEMVRAT